MPCQRSPDIGASDPLGRSGSAVVESLDSPDRGLDWPGHIREQVALWGTGAGLNVLHLPPPKIFEKRGISLRSNRDENSC